MPALPMMISFNVVTLCRGQFIQYAYDDELKMSRISGRPLASGRGQRSTEAKRRIADCNVCSANPGSAYRLGRSPAGYDRLSASHLQPAMLSPQHHIVGLFVLAEPRVGICEDFQHLPQAVCHYSNYSPCATSSRWSTNAPPLLKFYYNCQMPNNLCRHRLRSFFSCHLRVQPWSAHGAPYQLMHRFRHDQAITGWRNPQ